MSYYCDICDKTIKLRCKKKHLNSSLHKSLSRSFINRYCVKNPDFLQIENILNKYIRDYRKKFNFFIIECKFKLDFDNNIFFVNLYTKNNLCSLSDIRKFLLTKICKFERMGYKFTNISEMKILFVSKLIDMTYEYYINKPKGMLEWNLIKKTTNNPRLIKNFTNINHPLFIKYMNVVFDEGEIINLV